MNSNFKKGSLYPHKRLIINPKYGFWK